MVATVDRYDTTRLRLRDWFSQPLGQLVRAQERAAVEQILSTLFGYHILQLGALAETDHFLSQSRISHQMILDVDGICDPTATGITATPESLPLASDSIDAVLMPHTLEFADDPHAVLRETERVLISEGHVIIISFNQWSLWGVRRLLRLPRTCEPWNGQFLSAYRLKDWLSLLGFDITHEHGLCFRPPINHPVVLQRTERLEEMGRKYWPIFAGINIVVAKKRSVALTPIGLHRRIRRRVLTGVVEPTTRNGYKFDE